MLKTFIATIFTLFLFHASAQRKEIDSLNKLLPALGDTARINCLNNLAHYYNNCFAQKYTRTDSAELCAGKAYAEALGVKYQFGIANALFNIGETNLIRCNFSAAQKFIQKSILIFQQINALAELNAAYMRLIDVYLSECDNPSVLKTIQIPFSYYKKTKDIGSLCGLWESLGSCYSWQGDDEKAFECFKNEYNLLKNVHDSASKLRMLKNKQGLFQMAGWSDSLAACTAEIIAYEKKMGIDTAGIDKKGFQFFVESKWDSAEYYYKKEYEYIQANDNVDSILKERRMVQNDIDLASVYQMEGRHTEAMPMFLKALQYDREKNITSEELEVLLNISGMKFYDKKYDSSIYYAKTLLAIAQKTRASYYIQSAYNVLWMVYDKKKDAVNAYNYFKKYSAVKDSTNTSSYQRQLAVINELDNEAIQQQKINALDKDNKLKEATIQKNVLIRNILIGGVFILIFLGFIIYRVINLKRKNEKLENATLQHSLELERIQNEKKQSELQNKATELEMQALRSQMNPHFIFNCLSSINRFILKNKTEEASDYLTKFSRLIRMVLNNSKRAFISLEDELETLRLYLDMERLRFKDSFDYSFSYKNAVDVGNIFIPPLLLQPFAENAIWHGLMHKQERGILNFDLCAEEKFLICVISDNGVGREQAELLKSKSAEKQKSMGLKITTERLSLLNNNSNEQTFFTIEDLIDENENTLGTRVHLKIFYKEMMEV